MIAKLIVWDENRDAALRRLRRALADYQVAGVTTNVSFLGAIAAHPAFAGLEIDTGFIERHRADLLPPPAPVPALGLAFASLALLLWREDDSAKAAARSGDPHSPWHQTSGWRLNDDNHHDFRFIDGADPRPVTVHFVADGWQLDLPGQTLAARRAQLSGSTLSAEIGGERRTASVVRSGFDITVLHDGHAWKIRLDDPSAAAAEREGADGRLTAPMPGTVVQVPVIPGETVTKGQTLIVVEAMKMEHAVKAPAGGKVAAIHYKVGDTVAEGAELLAFEVGE